MKKVNSTLAINPSNSECCNCGKGADWRSKTHDWVYGYFEGSGTISGCGIEWTHLTSHYTNFDGLHDTIKKMRPDLVWVEA